MREEDAMSNQLHIRTHLHVLEEYLSSLRKQESYDLGCQARQLLKSSGKYISSRSGPTE